MTCLPRHALLWLCLLLATLVSACAEDQDEVCDDGVDNDGDTYVDCIDQDCWLEANCEPPGDDDDTGDDDDSAGDDDDSSGDDDDSAGDDDDDTTPCTDADGDNWCAEEDCDDSDPQSNPVGVELCDGRDNDCNGFTDEDAADAPTWYLDADNDGYGATHLSVESCAAPAGYVDNSQDCDDLAPETYPGATEICDETDNNCDSVVDEGVLVTWYTDSDGDGFGDAGSSQQACDQPAGTSINGDDCNDTAAAISPSAVELCDGIDNDCNQQTDEAGVVGTSIWYPDGDGDGFGDGAPVIACSASPGQVGNDDDCDDTVTAVNPAATEVCDGVDNNCDGTVDEGVESTWYADLDGDGAGGTLVTELACSQPTGYVALAQANDCDDLDATSFPGGAEVCDGADNNCDTVVDEGVTTTFFLDFDGDAYGDPGTSEQGCFLPLGYSVNNTDCDDGQSAAHPGGIELCDGIDNNCSGSIDDNALDADTWYPDADGDSYGDAAGGTVACTQPSGTVGNDQDCDDDPATGAASFPGATEFCDATDSDCNGSVVDNFADFDGDADPDCNDPDDDNDGDADSTDCDDNDATIFAGAAESCDAIDNDCDGSFDDPGQDECDANASCITDGSGYTCTCDAGSGYEGSGLSCACQSSLADCSGACLDLNTDDNNCGACGNVCGGGTNCNGGSCVSTPACLASGAATVASCNPPCSRPNWCYIGSFTFADCLTECARFPGGQLPVENGGGSGTGSDCHQSAIDAGAYGRVEIWASDSSGSSSPNFLYDHGDCAWDTHGTSGSVSRPCLCIHD